MRGGARSGRGRRSSVVWVLAALAVALTPACGLLRPDRPLVVAFDDAPETLDPHLQNHTVTWSVLGNIFDSLVRFSPEMRLEPALAVSWAQVDDRHWRLRLRVGVHFQDGAAFTADDVIASFERARSHPRSLVRHYLVGVQAMRKEDDLTLVVETSAPAPDLLNRLAFLLVVPRNLAKAAEITTPVGTGAYRFVRRDRDGTLHVQSWPGWRGEPEFARVAFTFLADEQVGVDRLLSGGVDVFHGLPDSEIQTVERAPGLRVVPQPRLAVQLLGVTASAAKGEAGRALADWRVRRALLLGLNRAGWVSRIYRGNGTVATQYVHPVVFGFDPGIAALPYNPEEARRLLADAGYPKGFDVTLGHGQIRSGVIEAIVEDLGKIGVRVTPQAISFGEALRLARSGEIALFYYAWACSTGDASDYLNTTVHTRDETRGLGVENYGSFSDLTADSLIEAADRERDPAKRLELLQRVQRRVLEVLPVLPLTIRWGYEGVSSRVDIVTRHDERVWVAAYRRRG